MKYKIGDRVTYEPSGDLVFAFAVDRIGTVVEVNQGHYPYRVDWGDRIVFHVEDELHQVMSDD